MPSVLEGWEKERENKMKVNIQEYGLVGENGVISTIGNKSNGVIEIRENELKLRDVEVATYRGITCRGCLDQFNLTLPLPLCYGGGGPYIPVGVSGYHQEINFLANFSAATNRKGILRLISPKYTSIEGSRGKRLQFVFEADEIKSVKEGVDVIYVKGF